MSDRCVRCRYTSIGQMFSLPQKRLLSTRSTQANGSIPLCAGLAGSSATAPMKEGRMRDQVRAEDHARVAAVRQRLAKLFGDTPATQAAPEKL